MIDAALEHARPPVAAKMLIDGKWIDADRRIEVFNPARSNELVGTIPRGTPDDVNRTVAAAKRAQAAGAVKTYTERAEILARVLTNLAQDIDERAALFVRENGKTLIEAKRELEGVPARQRLT